MPKFSRQSQKTGFGSAICWFCALSQNSLPDERITSRLPGLPAIDCLEQRISKCSRGITLRHIVAQTPAGRGGDKTGDVQIVIGQAWRCVPPAFAPVERLIECDGKARRTASPGICRLFVKDHPVLHGKNNLILYAGIARKVGRPSILPT